MYIVVLSKSQPNPLLPSPRLSLTLLLRTI